MQRRGATTKKEGKKKDARHLQTNFGRKRVVLEAQQPPQGHRMWDLRGSVFMRGESPLQIATSPNNVPVRPSNSGDLDLSTC